MHVLVLSLYFISVANHGCIHGYFTNLTKLYTLREFKYIYTRSVKIRKLEKFSKFFGKSFFETFLETLPPSSFKGGGEKLYHLFGERVCPLMGRANSYDAYFQAQVLKAPLHLPGA